jgi:hypothetical protein
MPDTLHELFILKLPQIHHNTRIGREVELETLERHIILLEKVKCRVEILTNTLSTCSETVLHNVPFTMICIGHLELLRIIKNRNNPDVVI